MVRRIAQTRPRRANQPGCGARQRAGFAAGGGVQRASPLLLVVTMNPSTSTRPLLTVTETTCLPGETRPVHTTWRTRVLPARRTRVATLRPSTRTMAVPSPGSRAATMATESPKPERDLGAHL